MHGSQCSEESKRGKYDEYPSHCSRPPFDALNRQRKFDDDRDRRNYHSWQQPNDRN
jgi:hypothetical protein